MEEKTLKPRIRFKGFTEAWEQRKVFELMDVGSVKRIHQSDWTSEGIRFLRARDIVAFHNGEEVCDPLFISEEKYDEYSEISGKVRIHDLLVTGVGTIGIPMLISDEKPLYFKDGNVIWMKNNDAVNGKFLFYSFDSNSVKSFINDEAGIGTVGTYTINSCKKTPLHIPNAIEQKKVGGFFDNLDKVITLHQRKFEKLSQIKKSLLEKMFPADGENTPKIRFKGFTEAWEQRQFSELYERESEKNDLTYGKDEIISVANMYFKADSYITDPEYLRTYNIFHLGDIAFEGNKSKDFAHGRFVENTIGNGIVSHVFDVFRPISEYDLLFWKYAINNERVMGLVLVRCTKASTMMTNLVANDFLQESILVPTVKEQQKIGAFLNQLDSLITLHQRKYEKLKNIKKSLLEKMFI